MTVTGDTVYVKSSYHDENPFLSLANYEDIGNGRLKTFFLIDIIGEVYALGRIQTVQVHDKDRKRIQFRMRDTNGLDVAYCLWGKYAEQFEAHIETGNDQMLICLIRFAKINIFRGSIQITNAFDASVVTLNPITKEAIDFKQKLLEDDLPLSIYDKKNDKKMSKMQVDDWNEIEVKAISEILVAYETGSCKIICSIESIDTDWGWFYFGCNGCQRRVTRIGRHNAENAKPLFRCEVCHANVTDVSPKFKLHLIVQDDSETCKIMLLDTVAKTIVGVEAEELWNGSYDEIEDPELVPEPVKNICGKSFCFGIAISSDSVANGADTFKVSEVWTNDKIYRVESPPQSVSQIEANSSTLSGGELSTFNPNSQNSSEGASTPFSKRSEGDAELKDMSSTSKKLCTKNIKLEKTKGD